MEKKLEDYTQEELEKYNEFIVDFRDFMESYIDELKPVAALSMATTTLIILCKKYGFEDLMKRTVYQKISD